MGHQRRQLLRALVETAGYSVQTTPVDAGYVLYLRRESERWQGRGVDEHDALDDALAQALPSHLGWRLLDAALARAALPREAESRSLTATAGTETATVPEAEPVAAPTRAEEPPAPSAAAAQLTEPVSTDALATAPHAPERGGTDAGVHGAAADSLDGRGDDQAVDASAVEPGPEREEPLEAAVAAPVEPGLSAGASADSIPDDLWKVPAQTTEQTWPDAPQDEAAAEAALQSLCREIREDLDELAVAPQGRQRVQITAWMARARAVESAQPGGEAHRRVSTLASQFSTLCKQWWPGNVNTLRTNALPSDIGADLGVGLVASWWQVAEQAELLLANEATVPAADGPLDWLDERKLNPHANDADSQLGLARQDVERVLGPVGSTQLEWRVERDRLSLQGDQWDKLSDAATRLRWIRDDVSKPRDWALLMGRLRWLAFHHPKPPRRLSRLLDPGFRPNTTWAEALGVDPHAKQRRRQLRKVLHRLDALGERPAEDALADWLVAALALPPETLSRARLAALAAPHTKLLLRLDPKVLAPEDRALRRKLSKLQGHLKKPQGDAATVRATLESDLRQPDTPTGAPPHEAMATALRAKTAGWRGLIVSNRVDHDVRKELETLLDMEIASAVATPRRTDAACEAIEGGRYDVVICATGFVGHSTEGHLRSAARGTDTRIVRAYKARVLGCLRAMARDLGVQGVGD